mmetsp:Transcript_25739/g.51281  ORF Transcript_25739/g.51281 Transcript_25739/m.51281 type:complete len:201 (+) Transcript_25739:992-1594(+)
MTRSLPVPSILRNFLKNEASFSDGGDSARFHVTTEHVKQSSSNSSTGSSSPIVEVDSCSSAISCKYPFSVMIFSADLESTMLLSLASPDSGFRPSIVDSSSLMFFSSPSSIGSSQLAKLKPSSSSAGNMSSLLDGNDDGGLISLLSPSSPGGNKEEATMSEILSSSSLCDSSLPVTVLSSAPNKIFSEDDSFKVNALSIL